MIDFNTLPLASKIILILGFIIGIASFLIFFRYTIILILMKYKPEYREYIKKQIKRYEKNNFRNRKFP